MSRQQTARAVLIYRRPSGEEQSFEVRGPRVRLGRATENDVVLRGEPSVSRQHAELVCREGRWFLVDLGSSNGTFVEGVRLEEPREILFGTTFAVGRAQIRFESQLPAEPSVAWLRPVGEEATLPFEIRGPSVVVGRGKEADLQIATDRSLSREHARFQYEEDGWFVEDLRSSNGTFVNEAQVTTRRALRDGDLLRLGNYRLKFALSPPEEPEAEQQMAAAAGVPLPLRLTDPGTGFVVADHRKTVGTIEVRLPGGLAGWMRKSVVRKATDLLTYGVTGALASLLWVVFVLRSSPGSLASAHPHWLGISLALGAVAGVLLGFLPHVTARAVVGPFLRLRRWVVVRRLRRILEEAERRYETEVEGSPGDAKLSAELAAAWLLGDEAHKAHSILEDLVADSTAAAAWNNYGVSLCRIGQERSTGEGFARAASLAPEEAPFHTNLGHYYLTQGEPNQAIEQLRRAAELDNTNAQVHDLMGVLFWRAGQMSEGLRSFQRAAAMDASSGSAHNNLGLALFSAGRTSESIREFRRALRAEPGHARAHANLGLALCLSGEAYRAIEELERAVRVDPTNATAYNSLGLAQYLTGMIAECEGSFTHATTAGKTAFEPHYNLGTFWLLREHKERALELLLRAAKLKPRDAATHVNLGCAFFLAGRTSDARSQFSEAYRLSPTEPFVVADLLISSLLDGKIGEVAPYVAALEKAERTHARISFAVAYYYHLAGDAEKALRFYDEALVLDPQRAEAHNNSALCHFHLGATDSAINALEIAAKLQPDLHTLPYNLGSLYAEKELLDAAIAQFGRAVRDEPLNPDAHQNLGLVNYRRDKAAAAAEAFRRVVNLRPNSAADHNNLGLAYAKAKRLEEAVYHFKRALELDPTNVIIHSNLGLAYYFRGATDDALSEWQRVSVLSPQYADERDFEQQREYDESGMSLAPLQWQARALYVPPLAVGFRYRFLVGYDESAWEVATEDPRLKLVPALLRKARRFEEALNELQA